ncbi:hypothetical protein DL766_000386 [Monosporascus sp. MC13-8B]|uniref:Uncharacterized protein n=1 Tax=Monosporascus cannonballus TaxID=155416 RepID=A0ABY0HGA5_9PEZI|nr:hypothetical protein DL762_001696 [Monosporascus cannonballus]RYO99954.1 hypothetical protein DL763_001085 [Monosporascus cannonballus]RYP39564.1 hypothetical protein DL766_000386 [Monosporascus sp. MC13-8B]
MSDQGSHVTIDSSSDENSDDVTPGLVAWKAELLRNLKAIKTRGDFASRDAEAIKAHSRQAPFGRGDQTLVDTSVRKTWELSTEKFRCSNPAWNSYLNTLLQEAAASLGMHEGGDVHLSHAEKNCVFATSGSSSFGLTALAWYSDVTHEIKVIKSGYRLVLTYNIVQENGSKTSAGYFLQQQTHLQSLIARWRSEFPSTQRLVYRLEHKYSQQSLSLQHMKGRDRPLVHSLDPDSEDEGEFAGNEAQLGECRYHDSNGSRIDNTILALVLLNARKLGHGALFRKAIQAAMSPRRRYEAPGVLYPTRMRPDTNNPFDMDRVKALLPTIGNICNQISNPQGSDWEECLGELVISLPSLEHVSSALDTVEGPPARDELKQSFLQWRSSADMCRFDNKGSLGSQDLDLILNIKASKADDDEWITSRLAPKLKECAERALLYKLLDGLFRKGEKNELARAEAIARLVLDATLHKLRLEIDDFSTSMVENQPRVAYSLAPSWDYPTCAVANFVRYLELFLRYDFRDQSKQLLELSCCHIVESLRNASSKPGAGPSGIVYSAPEKIKYMPSSFVREFLEALVYVAEKHQLPEIPSLRELFEILFRRYILVGLPILPPPPPGWTHKPRWCRAPYRRDLCPHCAELNQFLASSDQAQARFTKAQTYRDHIEKQLTSQFFRWWTEPSSVRGVNSTLVVTKLGTEYAEDVQQFLRSVATIEEGVRVFARGYVRRLLGDELYRELILLEKTRAPALHVTAQGIAVAAPTGPPGALNAPFGNAAPAGAGDPPGPGIPGYAYLPAPVGPGGPGYSLPPPVPAHTAAAAPPVTSVPLNYSPTSVPPGYPTQLPPINPGCPASPQRTVLPPLQPTTGNSGVKRPADGTWEQPDATKARTSEYVDLTRE